jgi:hypothetical protein
VGFSRRFRGGTIWIVDAHRDDGKRFIVHADEILTAFLELETAIRTDSLSMAAVAWTVWLVRPFGIKGSSS